MVSLCIESSARILVGFQGVVSLVDTVEYFINMQWRFGGSLNKMYPYGGKEWNAEWINKTGGER